jgi:hypothetical protein
MLIRRCAWHRLYHGYPMLYGVAAWRQRGIQFTDGMCRSCAATALREWSAEAVAAPRPRLILRRPSGIAAAAAAAFLLVALAFTVAAHRDGDGRDVGLSALPSAATGAGPETPREACD